MPDNPFIAGCPAFLVIDELHRPNRGIGKLRRRCRTELKNQRQNRKYREEDSHRDDLEASDSSRQSNRRAFQKRGVISNFWENCKGSYVRSRQAVMLSQNGNRRLFYFPHATDIAKRAPAMLRSLMGADGVQCNPPGDSPA